MKSTRSLTGSIPQMLYLENATLGGEFTRNHRILNYSQAYKVLETLKKFTDLPAAMKQG